MQGFIVYIKLPSATRSLERLKTSYMPPKAQNLRGKSRYVQIYSGPLLRFLFMLLVSPLISDSHRHNAVYHHHFVIKQYVFSCSMRRNFEKQNLGLKKKTHVKRKERIFIKCTCKGHFYISNKFIAVFTELAIERKLPSLC